MLHTRKSKLYLEALRFVHIDESWKFQLEIVEENGAIFTKLWRTFNNGNFIFQESVTYTIRFFVIFLSLTYFIFPKICVLHFNRSYIYIWQDPHLYCKNTNSKSTKCRKFQLFCHWLLNYLYSCTKSKSIYCVQATAIPIIIMTLQLYRLQLSSWTVDYTYVILTYLFLFSVKSSNSRNSSDTHTINDEIRACLFHRGLKFSYSYNVVFHIRCIYYIVYIILYMFVSRVLKCRKQRTIVVYLYIILLYTYTTRIRGVRRKHFFSAHKIIYLIQ